MGQPSDERRPVILAAESYDDRGVPGSLVGDVVDPVEKRWLPFPHRPLVRPPLRS